MSGALTSSFPLLRAPHSACRCPGAGTSRPRSRSRSRSARRLGLRTRPPPSGATRPTPPRVSSGSAASPRPACPSACPCAPPTRGSGARRRPDDVRETHGPARSAGRSRGASRVVCAPSPSRPPRPRARALSAAAASPAAAPAAAGGGAGWRRRSLQSASGAASERVCFKDGRSGGGGGRGSSSGSRRGSRVGGGSGPGLGAPAAPAGVLCVPAAVRREPLHDRVRYLQGLVPRQVNKPPPAPRPPPGTGHPPPPRRPPASPSSRPPRRAPRGPGTEPPAGQRDARGPGLAGRRAG